MAVRHHASVFGYCRRRLGNDSEADDAMQETFLRAFKYFHTFDASRDERKWLVGIAHNVCVEIARKRARHQTVEHFPDPADLDSPTNIALDKLAHEEQVIAVRRQLEDLPDKARRILELRYFGQMSGREIAEIEGMTEANVRVTLHRAMETLRARIGGQA